jgi:hypothetical protein
MPRFGTKSLLFAFGLIAVWFATFGASANSYASVMAAQDLRRSMLLLVLVIVICLALFTRGRRRVFWAAFALVMCMCGGVSLQRPLYRYVPDFAWQQVMGVYAAPYAPPAMPTPARISTGPNSRGQIVYSAPYAPTLSGSISTVGSPGWAALSETLAACWTFGLSGLSGIIASYVYARTRPKPLVAASPTARQIVEQELQS